MSQSPESMDKATSVLSELIEAANELTPEGNTISIDAVLFGLSELAEVCAVLADKPDASEQELYYVGGQIKMLEVLTLSLILVDAKQSIDAL